MVNHIPLFGENMCSHWNCLIIIKKIKKKTEKNCCEHGFISLFFVFFLWVN
jgi:hypothetical protein